MIKLDDFIRINQTAWNAWVEHDTQSEHHKDVERYLVSGSSLRSIEIAELGDVSGKTLLHLQCNMGADTLSWAKRGAIVTGVDLSEAAISHANDLSIRSQTPAHFIATDIYALPGMLDEQFDIVFTSYGVLWWLADLSRWAEIAASCVKPGGIFYIVDMHPCTNCLEVDESTPPRFSVAAPYAHPDAPLQILTGETEAPVRTWTYGLGEVVTALVRSGLHITYLHEHPTQFYRQFPALVQDESGWWRWPDAERWLPLLFSLHATKPIVPERA
jgi:SAM-dependent methyltransferase